MILHDTQHCQGTARVNPIKISTRTWARWQLERAELDVGVFWDSFIGTNTLPSQFWSIAPPVAPSPAFMAAPTKVRGTYQGQG